MDMTVIDTVDVTTLEAGDTIRFYDEDGTYLGLREVRYIEDQMQNGVDVLLIISTDEDEMTVEADSQADIYGYENGEDD